MWSIRQIETAHQIAAAKLLVRGYFEWFFALVPGSETDPTFKGWEDELETIPGQFIPPTGRFLIAEAEGQVTGCIVLKHVSMDTCELKRLFVHPSYRGKAVGQELVKAFLVEARVGGYKHAVLDSHVSMTGAHAIYRQMGFRVVSAPDNFPEELKGSVIFMRCEFED
jgi:N-acetylglutamate synthase-like GNAT family acetyltransferase